jgi:hypothetical protein
VDQGFEWGVIGLSRCDIRFVPVENMGASLILNFWAWGDDQEEVMENLARTFTGLFAASRRVSGEIAEALEKQSS